MDTNTRKKIRIVNKNKEGVTIDLRKAGGIIKMSWNIFNNLFDVCKEDTKFCYTKEDTNEAYNKFRRLLNKAVDTFSKSVKTEDNKFLEVLGKCYNDLIVLLKCTREDLDKLVVDKYIEVTKQKQEETKETNNNNPKKKQQKPNNYQKEKKNKKENYTKTIPAIPVSTFGDLTELKKLKKQLDDKG